MKRWLIALSLLVVPITVHAGVLDILQDGIKDNPDRYVSVDILGTWDEQQSLVSFPTLSDQQSGLGDDRGLRTQIRFPLTTDTTFLLGGNWSTGTFSYAPGSVLNAYSGVTQNYGVQAGFRFYIHN